MAAEKRMDQVILGFLNHEPMTGYEIKKRIDTTLRFFWSGSFGSIYPTLNALEKKGYVTKAALKEGRREKLVYTITDAGRDSLKEWMLLPALKDELHYETLLKLFFGSSAGSAQTLKHNQNFEDKIRAELPFLEACVKELEGLQGQPDHRNFMLTAMFGVDTYRTYISWCEKAKAILQEEDAT